MPAEVGEGVGTPIELPKAYFGKSGSDFWPNFRRFQGSVRLSKIGVTENSNSDRMDDYHA